MALTTQSTQAPGEKCVRSSFLKHPLIWTKQFLKQTIGHTRLYQAMRVGYSWYTKSKRQAVGERVQQVHRAKKEGKHVRHEQEEVRWSRQTPSSPLSLTQQPTPEPPVIQVHSIPLCGGAPIQVERAGDLARRYNEELARKLMEGIPTQPASIRPVRSFEAVKLTPIQPEVLPDAVGKTPTDDLFLLEDVTTKREAIKKVG